MKKVFHIFFKFIKFLIDEKYTASDYLVDYTIYSDIKLYQTHFKHFFDDNEPPAVEPLN
jgi:hypothetical protein